MTAAGEPGQGKNKTLHWLARKLAAGAEKNLPRLDEALFSELFSPHNKTRRNNVKKEEEK